MGYYGKCALCGKETELTFEHIPPRKAFNWFPQKTITGDNLINMVSEPNRNPWDTTGLQYRNDQRGMGKFTLCQECNNFTGSRYGNEYVAFAHGIHSVLLEHPCKNKEMIQIKAEFKPLAVFKQIISMFCSVNHSFSENDDFSKLRKFVMDEKSNDFPKKRIRVTMYLFSGNL
ncbi:MAG: hypothetical protein ACOYJS_06445, partial [Acutalibacteraceae bacterium]